MRMLRERLRAAGLDDVTSVEPVSGGLAATAGLARRTDAEPLFVKAFDADAPGDDVFTVEAEGLAALRAAGVETPEVVHAGADLLVLSALAPRPSTRDFWEELAHSLAHVHTTTRSERFGWHQDGWLGRRRQVNTWTEDGFEFFAQHRLLRWLDEPRVHAALGAADRAALERLCARLPEVLPGGPACLTHGDLWASNVMATADGRPALIDPAVSYTWAEVDLAHVWTTAPPPEADAFFGLYAELTGLDDDWHERMPVVQLRQHLAVVAQFEPDWGAADAVRATLAPFRTR
ncbi:fructosamine kinase family protein [Cellulosimicrobium cellulans]|uniref:fructosamine kinase family protein n=1 Tax=Cellulosimicrobium cellulans TaxID=1710 RepID=UPI0019669381|nr:fructosamine kinase family protein [Cellulosimicrobium cellulans]MBN0041068.1 fructosamine kinase family protein [Cellulosimicrobium cellulans]